MARRRGNLHKPRENATPKRTTRRDKASQQKSGVPDVFQDMLQDEQASKTAGADEDRRPLKKRKTAQAREDLEPQEPQRLGQLAARSIPASQVHPSLQSMSHSRSQAPSQDHTHAVTPAMSENEDENVHGRVLQTVIDSDESDESDLEWEDALGEDNNGDDDDIRDAEPEIGDISITIGGDKLDKEKTRRQIRRRAITSVEKKLRLDIHKMHILCLLYHVHRRNAWCNDERVQATLRKTPPAKTLSNLVPNPDLAQYQASKRFVDGMKELKLLWSKRFTVRAQGMYKPRWAEAEADVRPFSDFDELDQPIDRDDFRKAAHTLQGSQDLGAQLFCALLRGIGVEARLVCSLQCLPFASAAQPLTPQKPSTLKNTVYLDPYNKEEEPSPSKPRSAPSRPKKLSRLERIIGERHPVLNKTGVAPKQSRTYHTSYPVYWVEAFNAAQQKWVPIDPLSTFTVNAPEKLEPPLSFAQNSLIYAVAFEEDLTAKDVTRRYAKAYNAKTRKFRVECTPEGDKWWRQSLKIFKRSSRLDRDQVEDAALARKEAAEGIPKNVQDFKDHPIYVLERHLKHNEIIHPMNQVGKVNVGSSMNPKMEPIFRRKDVHIVRSADKWYRMGYDVKDGEQPLKHAKPKKTRRLSIGPDETIEDVQDEVGAALYAPFQTELYVPPPVIRGRIPRNAYGNLDLYVPSMCPPGGVHIRDKLAAKAARIVGVDYAEAVTGFNFKGRHGTAVVQGVVVAQEYAAAVQAVIEAMQYSQEEAEISQRRAEALRMWRRFYLGLRIAQRVNAIEIDGEVGPTIDVQEEIEREDREIAEKEFAGGFFPDEGDFANAAQPTARRHESPTPQYRYASGFDPDEAEPEEGDGFVPIDDDGGEGFVPQHRDNFGSSILAEQRLRRRRVIPDEDEDEDEDTGGGFLREDSTTDPEPTNNRNNSTESMAQFDGAQDTAGGFMVDDQPSETAESNILNETMLPSKSDDVPPHALHIPEVHPETAEEPAQAIPEAIIPEKPDDLPPQSERVPGVRLTQSAEIHQALSTSPGPTLNPSTEETQVSVIQVREPSPSPPPSSLSDTGSLPLEDPEDEDAEPDWLIDAT